jgi:hypothetical protein
MKDGKDRRPAPPGPPAAKPPTNQPPRRVWNDAEETRKWKEMEKRMEAKGLTNGF